MDLVINTDAEDRVRQYLNVLDGIECKMVDGLEYLVAKQLDTLTIREDHIDKLETEYYRWAGRLAGQLGVPLYPFSLKFKLARGRMAGTIPVSSG